MRVCVVSLNRFVHDPGGRVLCRSLVGAGHEVDVVAGGLGEDTILDGARLHYVPTRYPQRPGRLARFLRRIQPAWLRQRIFAAALARAARRIAADIYHPTSPAAVRVARQAAGRNGAVAREPGWPDAGDRDLVRIAPVRSAASVSGAGPGLDLAGGARPVAAAPQPGRHRGVHLALCYRKTDINPGRYLEAALRRSGATVDVYTTEVPWTRLAPSLDGVVFVESPYPALEIRGSNPGFPVLFWVHHGEHRLMANVRLCERYGAHGVLLGHSWHLAHRFAVPVHRFPFAVAPELFAASPLPLADRPVDVAFVGSGLTPGNDTYAARRALLSGIGEALGPERVAFREGIEAAQMAAAYEGARLVVDEGGTRHHPITMRVFEAFGAGAVLATDEAPGLGQLAVRGEHYVTLGTDPVAGVMALLDDAGRMEAIASAGYRHARERHTYDHRVDDLMAALASVRGERPRPPSPKLEGVAAAIADDVDVQRVAAVGIEPGRLAADLPLHEVWDIAAFPQRLAPRSYDAVAIGPDAGDRLDEAVAASRRLVFASGPADRVARAVLARSPGAAISYREGCLRADLSAAATG